MNETQSRVRFDSKDALAFGIAVAWVYVIQPRFEGPIANALGIVVLLAAGVTLFRSAIQDIRTMRH